jgi:hypothetical protein
MQNSGNTIQTMAARCRMTAHAPGDYGRGRRDSTGVVCTEWPSPLFRTDEKWLRFFKSIRTIDMRQVVKGHSSDKCEDNASSNFKKRRYLGLERSRFPERDPRL